MKSRRIKDISAAGLDVVQVIHRHKIESQEMAFQIEAALIDAYPGLTNIVGGSGCGDYGCRHVEEIVAECTSRPFKAKEPLILISVAKSYEEEGRTIYDAVRYAWKIDINRTKKFHLVLAHRKGLVIGAFRPKEWLEATKVNFPGMTDNRPGRWGFVGKEAEKTIIRTYNGKRVPDEYRAKGAAYPIRFVYPDAHRSQTKDSVK